jgi:bifunctional non-homologous end joining protein LigD
VAGQLREIERSSPAFAAVPCAYHRGARRVDPRLVAEVTFTTWTADHLLRHPSFEGVARG